MSTSPRFKLNKEDGKHVGKVYLYSLCSAVLTATALIVANLDVPKEYVSAFVLLLPVVNAGIVAGKKWLSEHGSLV